MKAKEKRQGLTTSGAVILYELVAGILELILGSGLALFGRSILKIIDNLRNSGIIANSPAVVAGTIERLIPYLFEYRAYLALFLIALGLGKIVSGIGLYHKREWARHLLVALLLASLPLDGVSLIRHFSLLKILYLSINVAIIAYMAKLKPWRDLVVSQQNLKRIRDI